MCVKMREILFRGKRKGNDFWIQGDLVRKNNICYIYIAGIPREVIAESIGEYTGITDKNGVRIFEGDIVNVFYNPNYIGISKDRVGNFIVVFHDGCFMKRKITKPMSDDAGLYHFIQSDEFEVIGNIYDNPELMGDNTNG